MEYNIGKERWDNDSTANQNISGEIGCECCGDSKAVRRYATKFLEKDETWFKKMMKGCVGFYESNANNEKLLYKKNEESFLTPAVKKELAEAAKSEKKTGTAKNSKKK